MRGQGKTAKNPVNPVKNILDFHDDSQKIIQR
jgi:hypothetical protein